jgi:uncharacterized protein YdbL (DUF1318 family)
MVCDETFQEDEKMKRIVAMSIFVLFTFCVLNACVTINIYFPAAAVEKAADRIVEEVWGDEESTPVNPQQQGEPQSRLDSGILFFLSVIGPREAFAQEADINVTTPAIRALKEGIKKRAESVKPFLDSGNIGIAEDGLLSIRSTEGLSLKDQASLSRLVNAENTHRKALYGEIAKANNFPPERISDIQSIFAKSWMKQAHKGWWVQSPGGQWNRTQ